MIDIGRCSQHQQGSTKNHPHHFDEKKWFEACGSEPDRSDNMFQMDPLKIFLSRLCMPRFHINDGNIITCFHKGCSLTQYTIISAYCLKYMHAHLKGLRRVRGLTYLSERTFRKELCREQQVATIEKESTK